MRKLMVFAAVAALGGCAGVGTDGFAYKGNAILDAQPLPVLSGYEDYDDYGDEEEGEPFIKFGARGGVVIFGSAVPARLAIGAYGRMFETDAGRVEVSIEMWPDIPNLARSNLSLAFAADYVGFISDMLYWKAGINPILDLQGDKKYFIFGIEGGVGLWIPVGEEEATTAVTVNMMLQLPLSVVGGTKTSGAYFSITGGYEF